MKKHLNTLYVTKEGAYAHRDGETVVVEVEKAKALQLPIHTLQSIVIIGHDIMVSPGLMHLCSEHAVSLAFFSANGRFIARMQGPQTGNVLLRREQYRRADDFAASLEIARPIVAAKVVNARSALQRCLRNYPEHEHRAELTETIDRLGFVQQRVREARSLDELRGIEGEAANEYFSRFDDLITAQKESFRFAGRNRRPPRDPLNAMLSFTYTLLHHDVASALEGVGLDPAVGFMHRDRPGRHSLALDVMEEFRVYIADRLVLSLINLGQVKEKDFEKSDSGAVVMCDAARKELITTYQKRKQEEIKHPYLEESVGVGLLPHIQAQLLARYLRGDLDLYPAFVYR